MCFGRIKIGYKLIVCKVSSFGGFHENKLNRELPLSSLLQHLPIHIALIMGDVNTMYLISMRHTYAIAFQTVTRFPTIGIGTDKEPIETGYKHHHNQHTKEIPTPCRHLLLCFLFPLLLGYSSLRSRLYLLLPRLSFLYRFIWGHFLFSTWKPSPTLHRYPDFHQPDMP